MGPTFVDWGRDDTISLSFIKTIETSKKADTMYIHLSNKPVAFSVEVSDDVVLDIDKDNLVVGIDI